MRSNAALTTCISLRAQSGCSASTFKRSSRKRSQHAAVAGSIGRLVAAPHRLGVEAPDFDFVDVAAKRKIVPLGTPDIHPVWTNSGNRAARRGPPANESSVGIELDRIEAVMHICERDPLPDRKYVRGIDIVVNSSRCRAVEIASHVSGAGHLDVKRLIAMQETAVVRRVWEGEASVEGTNRALYFNRPE